MTKVTRLGVSGLPRQPYGSFANKGGVIRTLSTVTRLGGSGFPRHLHGSFANKAAGAETPQGLRATRFLRIGIGMTQ